MKNSKLINDLKDQKILAKLSDFKSHTEKNVEIYIDFAGQFVVKLKSDKNPNPKTFINFNIAMKYFNKLKNND